MKERQEFIGRMQLIASKEQDRFVLKEIVDQNGGTAEFIFYYNKLPAMATDIYALTAGMPYIHSDHYRLSTENLGKEAEKVLDIYLGEIIKEEELNKRIFGTYIGRSTGKIA